jgi:cation-transporting ATPase E
VFGVGALVFCGKAFHLNNADISTAATLLLSVIGFMVLFKVSRPMNTLRMVVLIGNMIALVFTGVFFNHLFALEAMSLECILLFIMFSFAAESFLRYLEKFVDWCYSVIKKRNYKKANNI